MAARNRKYQTNKTREKIKTTALINRLQDFALGKIDPRSKEPIKMTSAQVTAAVRLIDKNLPTLSEATMIHQHEPRTEAESYNELESLVGKEQAKAILDKIKAKTQVTPETVH